MSEVIKSALSDDVRFCSKCHACKRVLREAAWTAFLYGITLGPVDRRLTLDELWARHQEIFNAE